MDTLAHCPRTTCIRFVGRYRLRGVRNRDIHIRCTIFTVGHDESCHGIYSILFTIYNRPSDHEISPCCLHFKRNVFGCIDTKIFYTRSFHWSWKDRARLICIEFMVVGISIQLTIHFSSFSPLLSSPSFFFPASFYLFKCGISYKSLMLHPLLSKLLPMFINFSPFLPRKSNVY